MSEALCESEHFQPSQLIVVLCGEENSRIATPVRPAVGANSPAMLVCLNQKVLGWLWVVLVCCGVVAARTAVDGSLSSALFTCELAEVSS